MPRRIRYVHGLAEECGLESGSVDLITYQVCMHAAHVMLMDESVSLIVKEVMWSLHSTEELLMPTCCWSGAVRHS